jgi:uncharacterized protein (TIGR02246 family)
MAQAAVDRLLDELAGAWNAGDARAYGALFSPDVTFTNTDGSVDLGRDEVVRHADEAFRGVLAGTTISLAVRKLRLIRPDVAVADLSLRISGLPVRPGTSDVPAGEMHASLLLVLVEEEEDGRWQITAHHNVAQSAAH